MDDAKSSKIVTKFMFIAVFLLFTLNAVHISDFNINSSSFQNFSIIFISILIDAFPFILLGAFVSSILHVYASEKLIEKIIPQNRFLGIAAASLCGMVFPICECAIVPIAHSLIKKGVPNSIAITFMLAVPIANPVVLAATYYAFPDKPYIVFIRAVFGIMCAIIIGLIMEYLWHGKVVINDIEHHDGCCHKIKDKNHVVSEIIEHSGIEFYNIGKLLIAGSLISAGVQTFIPQRSLSNVRSNAVSSIIIMMLMAYVLSICSEADAFVGRSFYPSFSISSICSFLIIGPMIDIKNTIMIFSMFKKKFAVELIFFIVLLAFTSGFIIHSFGL